MSLIFPFVRDDRVKALEEELLRGLAQFQQPAHQACLPVRIRAANWPLGSSFEEALSELQDVMENVNGAIGNYQKSLVKDLSPGGIRTRITEDGALQVAIDVGQYKPEEIQVKLCDDNLMVEAKTETSEADSYHKAEFKRRIKLPADAKYDGVKSTLTQDKKLLIEVPVNKKTTDARSRNIPIEIQRQPVEACKQTGGDQKMQNGQQTAQDKR